MKLHYLILIFSLLISSTAFPQKDYIEKWQKVESFELNGKTSSANNLVKEIYQKSKKEDQEAQIIKSLLYQSKFALTLEEDAALKIKELISSEIKNSETRMKAVLFSILAEFYVQYLDENNYKNKNRTRATFLSSDFRDWDNQTLKNQIIFNFSNSLQDQKILQNIPLDNYDDLLLEPDFNPVKIETLFELLSYRALNFYKEKFQNVQENIGGFPITSVQYLIPPSEFVGINLEKKDSTSSVFQALKIFQDLEKFYLLKENPVALAQATQLRFDFIKNHSIVDPDIFLKKYRELISQLKNPQAIELLEIHLAYALNERFDTENFPNDKKEAVAICEKIIANSHNQFIVEKSKMLLHKITQKVLKITAKPVIPSRQYSKLLVHYKNLDSIQMEIYRINLSDYELWQYNLNKIPFFSGTDSLFQQIKDSQKPVYAKTIKLPGKKDYLNHSTEILVPKLKNGQYLILTGNLNKNKTRLFSANVLQVSDLSLSLLENKNLALQVLNRSTGNLVPDANIFITGKRKNKYPVSESLETDSLGKATFLVSEGYYGLSFLISKDEDTLFVSGNYSHSGNSSEEKIKAKAFLFTDRSIYRPGQKLYFKGIILTKNQKRKEVVDNHFFKIIIKDANGSELDVLRLKSNEFGSIKGEFIIPKDLRTGEFSISLEEDDQDLLTIIDRFNRARATFSVEEYKRPKFQILFDTIHQKYKLHDKIEISGSARAYFGAGINNANGTFKVLRTTTIPYYGLRFPRPIPVNQQEISIGKFETDEQGNFSISFPALPGYTQKPSDFPVFHFEIRVSITDINGETRSNSKYIHLGHQPFVFSIQAPEKIQKGEKSTIILEAKNHNGAAVEIAGKLKVYKLKSPNRVLKTRDWPAPELVSIPKEEFIAFFPFEAFKNKNNFKNWEKADLVLSKEIRVNGQEKFSLPPLENWKLGRYIAIFETKDESGKLLQKESFFKIYDNSERISSENTLFEYFILNKNYKEDGFIKLKLVSAAESLRIKIEAYYKSHLISEKITMLNKGAEIIKIPVGKDFSGDIKLRFSFVKHNSFEEKRTNVEINEVEPEIKIHLSTFRNKIKPGQPETWTFHLENENPSKQVELLASMYDISLDQFKLLQWPADLSFTNEYYDIPDLNFPGTKTTDFKTFNRSRIFLEEIDFTPPDLKNFGFSYNNFPFSNYEYLSKLLFPDTKPVNYFISEGGLIKGKIFSLLDRSPLPGVNILITGTRKGTQTDYDGNFSIETEKGDRLIASYLGFGNKNLFLWKDNFLTIFMIPENYVLQEVVALNYGQPIEEAEQITLRGNASFKELPNSVEKIPPPRIQIRKDFKETAFFMPQLKTDKDGNIKITFEAPEALSQWKLMLFAHNKKGTSAYKEAKTITQKELMIVPNLPRFLRVDDSLHISAKISNISTRNLSGVSQLQLYNAVDNQPIILKNGENTKEFQVSKEGNTSIGWDFIIPENIEAVRFKIIAKTEYFTDGIESILPVLPNRKLVTEALAFWVPSNSTETYNLEKPAKNKSTTLKNHSLTLEYTSNPAWLAMQSLPYLIEFPYKSSEQIFAKFYSNSLASKIITSNPKIEKVFESWRKNGQLKSKLAENEELKSILLQETPWVLDAKSDTEREQRLAELFKAEKLKISMETSLTSLEEIQRSSGGFPWFEGGRTNSFITSHILAGLGHLEKLGALKESEELHKITKRGISFLDKEFVAQYKRGGSVSAIHLLYTRSFYLEKYPIPKELKPVLTAFIDREKEFWVGKSLYEKGLLAIIFSRMNEKETAKKIIVSLQENAINTKKTGMYWKANKNGHYWYNSAIETQALLIEAFSEIVSEDPSIEDMKIWLLKNKRTNSWNSTKATTNAIYALLLQGKNWLAQNYSTTIHIGDHKFVLSEEENNVQEAAGSGYFKKVWGPEEITPEMAHIKVENKTEVPSFGGLYWQYFEDLDKITEAGSDEIKLEKQLFLKENSENGSVQTLIDENTILEVGDLITVKISLEVNSRFEYVHLKDMRAVGLEPINVLSSHKNQDGLWYFESTKDVATNFFFDVLPKGNYIFEYDLRVNNSGNFSNGITTIQSMYAPEFTSHSKGNRISVKK